MNYVKYAKSIGYEGLARKIVYEKNTLIRSR